MIYNELPYLAHKCGFNMNKSVDRHRVYQLAELVIREVSEQLGEQDRLEVYKRFNIYERQ